MAPPTSILTPTNIFDNQAAFGCSNTSSIRYIPAASQNNVTYKLTSFDTLVQDICQVLGPSSGIDDVDVDSLMSIMEAYNPTYNSHEWEKYALCDPARGYTRNGVDECNKRQTFDSCLEPKLRVTHPRSFQCALCHEDS